MTDTPTYDEGIELAATLYKGMRLAQMALTGDLGMERYPEADRESAQAMIAEIRDTSQEISRMTRKGRAWWPESLTARQGRHWLTWTPDMFDVTAKPQVLTLFAEPDRYGTPDMFADAP